MPKCPECGQQNPDGFKYCGACGAELLAGVVSAREVRKTVTVLFCDVVGYTSKGEGLDPEALRRVQSRYFEDARAALERHGGTVEKFIGDAVMAVFGIPQLHEDDALRAIKAAVELRQAVVDLELQARIGVNTGEVMAGSGDALVTGDAVNTAARLEQAAAPGEILTGEQTLRLCHDAVEVQAVAPLELKGKGEAVVAYRVLRILKGAPGYERRLESVMVGRERELASLRQAFDRAVSGRACHLFTVLGSAGVGKSRLAAELVAGVGGDATVWMGRCLSYGEGITYWPLVEVFREARAEDELEQALVQPTPEETSWAVRTFIERRARKRPVVLVLDDLHWAEPTFLDLVEHVADLSRDAPILLLCLARSELLDARPTWGGGKLNATTVLLEALTVAESKRLIVDLTGGQALDEKIRRRIVEAAEGNPLFVEEMLAMVAEKNGHDDRDVEVPSTIQALLAARLERLHPGELQVIQRAAVEGKVFHRAAVGELAPLELRPEVTAHLVSLVRKELIRPEEAELSGEDAFRFRHQLIRDAAYHSLPKEERVELHQRFAAWLERATGARALEFEEIAGYHFEQAYRYQADLGPVDEAARELASRAAACLARAGGRAFARNDMPAAAKLLGRAAALLERGDPGRATILPDLGAALGAVGDLARAEDVLAHAVAEAQALKGASLEARAVAEQVLLRFMSDPEGRAQEARTEGERLIAALEGSDDDRALAKAWYLVGFANFHVTQFADMDRAMSRSLEHADRAGDLQQQSAAIQLLAVATAAGPTRVADGIVRLERLGERVSDGSQAEAGLLVNLALLQGMAGRIDEARRLAGRGRAIFKELGMEIWWASNAIEVGHVERYAGDPAVAEPALRRACEALQRMGERGFLSTTSAVLAQTLYALERHEEADEWTHVSEEAAALDDLLSQMVWRSVRGKVLARRGELDDGERLAREAVALAETSDMPFTGDALLDLAEVLRLANKDDEARSCIQRALALYEQKGVVRMAERARSLLAELKGSSADRGAPRE
jgi:class 3 adenylate cyclase/tetratricopeptide (TPR) repeat protein